MTELLINEVEECICLISEKELTNNEKLKESINSLAKSLKKVERKLRDDRLISGYIDRGLLTNK